MGAAAAMAACDPRAGRPTPGRRPVSRPAGRGRLPTRPGPYPFAPSPLTRTRHRGGPEPSPLICFTTTRPSTSRVV